MKSVSHCGVKNGVVVDLALGDCARVSGERNHVIIRGVRNGSALNANLSAFIPLYGLIYFFVAKSGGTVVSDVGRLRDARRHRLHWP